MIEFDDERVSIPLRMFDGNIAVMLETGIPCNHISFERDPGSPNGVILIIRGTPEQKEEWDALGFRHANMGEKPAPKRED